MGGKKKLTLKKMERVQERQKSEGKSGASTRTEKKSIGIIPPDPRDEKIIKELKKMKVLTPYMVASRFDIRLSVAKDFLEELQRQGLVEYVHGGRNIKIYKPVD